MITIILVLLQLLFPTSDSARPFSMLGLGDIVIPGIMSTKLEFSFIMRSCGFELAMNFLFVCS